MNAPTSYIRPYELIQTRAPIALVEGYLLDYYG